MATLMPCLLVGLGRFIGANARFVVARLVGALFATRFPMGTFVINVSGSFVLGALGTVVAQRVMPNSEAMRLALGVGFLGAFTTFSMFEFEMHALGEGCPATRSFIRGCVGTRTGRRHPWRRAIRAAARWGRCQAERAFPA